MPYNWTLTSGNLPPGLSLKTLNNGRVGYLIGRPTQIGSYAWRYTVTDDTLPNPLSAYNDYTMEVSSTLYFRGKLVFDNWTFSQIQTNGTLGGAYSNQLTIEEAGAHDSVFTATVIEGTKPSWLTVTVTPTTNRTDGVPVIKYCFAYINFTGTAPDTISTNQFRLRLTSTSGAYFDTGLIKLDVAKPGVTPIGTVTNFKLSSNKSSINEGDSVVVTLRTTNQPNNSTHAYKITGVTSGDIDVALEGSITVVEKSIITPVYTTIDLGPFGSTTFISSYTEEFYQEGTLTIAATADLLTEGVETMVVSLPSRVQLGVAGDVPSISVNILDTSVTPAVPTYALSSSAASVQEGNPFTITLTTSNVPTGTQVGYQVSGVALNTFQRRFDGAVLPSTGNLVVGNDGTASITYTPLANELVEPNRTFTFSIPSKNISKAVTITDAAPTYLLTSSSGDIAEGDSVVINLQTTTVADGTSFAYKITGVQSTDIDVALTGTLTVSGGVAGITINAIKDSLTESTPDGNQFEIMTFEIPSVNKFVNVRIRDTSLTPPPERAFVYVSGPVTSTSAGDLLDGSSTITLGQVFKIIAFATASVASVNYKIEGIPDNAIDIPLTGVIKLSSFSTIGGTVARGELLATTKTNGQSLSSTATVSFPNITSDGTNIPIVSFLVKSPAITAPDPPTTPECPVGYFRNTQTGKCELISQPDPTEDPPVLVVIPGVVPAGYIGVNYSQSFYITYSGGRGPLTWSKTSGTLPPGLALKTENGNLSGNRLYVQGSPTTAGLYQNIVIQGSDQNNESGTITISIIIANPPSDTGGAAPGGGDYRPGDPGQDTEFTFTE